MEISISVLFPMSVSGQMQLKVGGKTNRTISNLSTWLRYKWHSSAFQVNIQNEKKELGV